MVRNQITYAGEIILTIYHKGFDEIVGSRELNFEEEIEGHAIEFTERVVEDEAKIEQEIEGWYIKEEGLLKNGLSMNPYGDQATAKIELYRYLRKPTTLFVKQGNRYNLTITAKEWIKINRFIKKYTGINIQEYPMLFGSVLVTESYGVELAKKGEGGIVIENAPEDSIVIIRFKQNELIVSNQVLKNKDPNKSMEVSFDKGWNSFDIEMYQEKDLIYFQEDISFLNSIHLNITNVMNKTVDLDTLESEISLKVETNQSETVIGNQLDDYEALLRESSDLIKCKMRHEEIKASTTFIQPGEGEKAYQLITNELQKNSDELWIFDPYFSSVNSKKLMIDWLRIFVQSPAKTKNVVFYYKEDKNLDVEGIYETINQDRILRKYDNLGIVLWQTNDSIHDRFILLKNGDTYSGITIGTSFNTLDDNYYCITPLNQKGAEAILSDLQVFLEQESEQREV